MNEYKMKEQICEIGRRLYNRGFAAANDGNITMRINDKELFCTPTMVSKGFMKPDDICKVDYDGKQLAGSKRRTSEVLLHLAVYKNRPDVNAVVHCHPPHATAFAVAHEPIPKCILPEVEVFLGEVPIAKYATPGDRRLPDTIVPYVKDCNTILLANHGTVTFGPTLENAYFNTEIIDAYCRILILSKLLGRVNYFGADHTKELLEFKKRLGYDDVRFNNPQAPMCGLSTFDESYDEFVPQPRAFQSPCAPAVGPCSIGGNGKVEDADMEMLVQTITERVMEALAGAGVAQVPEQVGRVMARWIATWVVVALLIATLGVTVWLYLYVESAEYHWAVALTFRILWGCWIVALFAIILTRVTIFGWSFRRYFRWDEPTPPPAPAPRPTRAPWNKGSKSSFGFTVSMVSVTGASAIAIVVLWMLEGVTGTWVFWLVSMIIGVVWWVTVITLVLTRIAIFGTQRHKKAHEKDEGQA